LELLLLIPLSFLYYVFAFTLLICKSCYIKDINSLSNIYAPIFFLLVFHFLVSLFMFIFIVVTKTKWIAKSIHHFFMIFSFDIFFKNRTTYVYSLRNIYLSSSSFVSRVWTSNVVQTFSTSPSASPTSQVPKEQSWQVGWGSGAPIELNTWLKQNQITVFLHFVVIILEYLSQNIHV
jgi:hypothetical protein